MHKNRFWLIPALILLALFLLMLVGPFLVPVPPLEGIRPISELVDPDSQFVLIDGINLHYKESGEGEPDLILLHGFGASVYSWHKVMQPLGELGTVLAYDRPAFGLTERPREWEGENPYGPEAQVELLVGLMDAMGMEKAVLVGNSAGGTVAVHTALTYPARVEALILVDAAIYAGAGAPDWIKPLLGTPQMRHLGPLFVRQLQTRGPELIDLAWHDPSLLMSEDLAGYSEPLMVEGWDRALWEMTLATHELDLVSHLNEIDVPVLVITGDDDRIVPAEQSIRLAQEIPAAQLVVVPDCGHLPHEESPDAFMAAVKDFLAALDH